MTQLYVANEGQSGIAEESKMLMHVDMSAKSSCRIRAIAKLIPYTHDNRKHNITKYPFIPRELKKNLIFTFSCNSIVLFKKKMLKPDCCGFSKGAEQTGAISVIGQLKFRLVVPSEYFTPLLRGFRGTLGC